MISGSKRRSPIEAEESLLARFSLTAEKNEAGRPEAKNHVNPWISPCVPKNQDESRPLLVENLNGEIKTA